MRWNPFRGASKARRSIRITALLVLLVGLGAGIIIGLQDRPVDTLSVGVEPEVASAEAIAIPAPDTDLPQRQPIGAALAQAKQDSTAVQEAKDKISERARQATDEAAQRSRNATEAAKKREDEKKQKDEEPSGGSGEEPPLVPVDCESYSGNRQIGCSLLGPAGFDTGQMGCLDKLWTKESNWRERATNPSSGAYGIPQALPAEKMASYGDDWRTNPVPQIKWGLDYIKGRYGTPCSAWSHSQATGWY